MLDSQPAWKLPSKEKAANVKAVEILLRRSAHKPRRITEFFGGIGGVTKRVRAMFPDVPIQSWDMDDYCLKLLGAIPNVETVKGDSIANCTPRAGDGVLMDCNIWTVHRARTVYAGMMTRVFKAKPTWVQVADSAVGKLHINYKTYGLERGSISDYVEKLDEWAKESGYYVDSFQQAHYKTIMFLLKPEQKK